MPTDSFSSREDAPPFIRPFLDALDRMRAHTVRPPEELKERARELMAESFGASSHPAEAVFAQGAVSLLSDHTHYSNGFAVLMPVKQGTAAAIRSVEGAPSRVIFEGDDTAWNLGAGARSADTPVWVHVVEQVVERIAPSERPVEIGVVSTLPSSCLDAYLSALCVATARGVLMLDRQGEAYALEPHLPTLRRILAQCTGVPFSIAFPIASHAGDSDTFTLVDTATCEYLPVETTARAELGWSLVDPEVRPREAAFHRERRDRADEALEVLRKQEFPDLTSFRELEHRDLPRAIEALPERLVAVARHLVTENRRVQKLVAAMRRSDWQMIGALLLMSHASRRDEWESTSPEADLLIEQVEDMTLESIYGACMTGRGGYVVVVGQPHAMMLGLDRLTTAFEQRFGRTPEVMLL